MEEESPIQSYLPNDTGLHCSLWRELQHTQPLIRNKHQAKKTQPVNVKSHIAYNASYGAV